MYERGLVLMHSWLSNGSTWLLAGAKRLELYPGDGVAPAGGAAADVGHKATAAPSAGDREMAAEAKTEAAAATGAAVKDEQGAVTLSSVDEFKSWLYLGQVRKDVKGGQVKRLW